MFAYIEGKFDYISPSLAYINVGGIGYEIQLTLYTYEAIQTKKEGRLYTHLQIREDAWILYGFATEEEREAFRRLISVSGVGAATARILLSSLSSAQLFQLVASGDSKALEKVKGIGSKTAQRIILELKGKLPEVATNELTSATHNTMAADALNALTGLGIARNIADAALKKSQAQLPAQGYTVEDWIKAALKCL